MSQSLTTDFNHLQLISTTYTKPQRLTPIRRWDSGAESFRSASFRLCRFLVAVLRRRGGFERMQKTRRDCSHLIDCCKEGGFVGFRRFVETGDLPYELQRGGSNLFGVHWRIKVEEGFDVPAHSA